MWYFRYNNRRCHKNELLNFSVVDSWFSLEVTWQRFCLMLSTLEFNWFWGMLLHELGLDWRNIRWYQLVVKILSAHGKCLSFLQETITGYDCLSIFKHWSRNQFVLTFTRRAPLWCHNYKTNDYVREFAICKLGYIFRFSITFVWMRCGLINYELWMLIQNFMLQLLAKGFIFIMCIKLW